MDGLWGMGDGVGQLEGGLDDWRAGRIPRQTPTRTHLYANAYSPILSPDTPATRMQVGRHADTFKHTHTQTKMCA
jgi:hypothetical protein